MPTMRSSLSPRAGRSRRARAGWSARVVAWESGAVTPAVRGSRPTAGGRFSSAGRDRMPAGPVRSRGRPVFSAAADMRLQELIPPQHIVLGLEAADKWEVIERLTGNLRDQGAVPEELAGGYRDAVVQRERSMSTGMERGIAIPHAAVDGLERVVAGLGVVAGPNGEGVPFDSVDSGPAWLVVLLLIPRPQKLLHIRTLADLARHLGSEDVRQALRNARTREEAWKALARA